MSDSKPKVMVHQFSWAKATVADWAEFESTIVHALMLGIDKADARRVVKGLRRNTDWSWGRIRQELLRVTVENRESNHE